MYQSSQMQIQQHSNGSEPQTLTNLQKFIQNYNKFIIQNPTVQFNSLNIINDISINILKPPISQTDLQTNDLYNLYTKGKSLPQTLDPKQGYLPETISRLKKLKQDKVYETIMFIEQLNYRLNKQYEQEVNKGIENGVYNKKAVSGSMENLNQSQGNTSNNGSNSHIKIFERR